MSGSETGLLTSREPFSIGLQKGPVASQPMLQNMRMPFAAADGTGVYKPIAATSPSYQSSAGPGAGGGGGAVVSGDGSAGGGIVSPGGGGGGSGLNMNNMGSGGETMKRKRGRPRKYGPDGTMALALSPPPPSVVVNQSGGGGFSSPHTAAAAAPPSDGGSAGGPGSPSSMKKARGRPPGSTKKQQSDTMGSAGFGFTPHVITVKAGEDVSSKIMSFSQHGPRAVCILSANGAISNVTLRQPATSGGTVTYEGRFEILSLSGSFLLSENGGQRSRTGGLSVSLSGPDGRVLGGGVAGLLMAASPVQVVVGSFVSDGRKESKSANRVEPLSVSQNLGTGGGPTGPGSPASRGTLSESSGGPGSPLNHSTGACNNNNQPLGMSSMPWK
ncbi:AT-hook motif nuclear-localized protein 10 [Humulus lupulus]|uniref:AT-hook motif nuclear-localized protein 10 n=1 Tax=Humulus lupulus TaxID=3486 RepID=UPI002B418000|nr:AT-hook motif nuclear-localized protein 10 [Humulus lupulus]